MCASYRDTLRLVDGAENFMATLSKTTRTKIRVIVGVLGIWTAVAIGTALWPRFPAGNCPDTPPDTAYVCRVAFGQDFEKASRRRNVLVVLEVGVLLSVGSALWLLSDKPLRRRRTYSVLSGSDSSQEMLVKVRYRDQSGQPEARAEITQANSPVADTERPHRKHEEQDPAGASGRKKRFRARDKRKISEVAEHNQ